MGWGAPIRGQSKRSDGKAEVCRFFLFVCFLNKIADENRYFCLNLRLLFNMNEVFFVLKRNECDSKQNHKTKFSLTVILLLWWEKLNIFTMLAHRWNSSSYFFPPNKNKIRNPIKERTAANGISVSVATAASD